MNTPVIVAELSCNHAGSLDTALDLVSVAAGAGANAIKLQTWTRGTMVIGRHTLKAGLWAGRDLTQLYEEAHTPWEWHKPIFDLASELGIVGFSSVFDLSALAFLESLDCPMYKIASFEMVDERLVASVAATKKPLIISTGMAEQAEIEATVHTARGNGCQSLTLLHCISSYPAKESDVNLATMAHLRQRNNCAVGFSDHTPGIGAAILAAGLGATVIEKHLAMDSSVTLDKPFSVPPYEFEAMVRGCREASHALGHIQYGGKSQEEQKVLRRSLYFAANLKAGTIIEAGHMITARPALGASPYALDRLVGGRLRQAVSAGDPVHVDGIERS
jgi:N-acetylneuraminate synthase